MSKYIVEYTTVNPAYEEGRKTWKAVAVVAIVIIALATIF